MLNVIIKKDFRDNSTSIGIFSPVRHDAVGLLGLEKI